MDRFESIIPEDSLRIDNRMYFVSGEFNGLFYSDAGEEIAHLVGSVPGEFIDQTRLYDSMQCIGGRYVCLIPFCASEIAIYDTKTDSFTKISLPDKVKEKKVKFMPAAVVGDDIYLFEIMGDCIYKLSSGFELIEVCSWRDKLDNDIIFDSSDAYFRYQLQVVKDSIYIPFCNANALLVYNYILNACSIKRFGCDDNGYSGIRLCGDSFYLSPRNVGNYGIRWDLKNDLVEATERYNGENGYVIGMMIKEGKAVYCYNTSFSFTRSVDNYMYDIRKQKLIDMDDDKLEWSTIVDIEELKRIQGEYANNIVKECSWNDLEKYIEIIK